MAEYVLYTLSTKRHSRISIDGALIGDNVTLLRKSLPIPQCGREVGDWRWRGATVDHGWGCQRIAQVFGAVGCGLLG